MRQMINALALMSLVTAQGIAHEAGTGPHGGPKVDAGPYHAELVVDGSTTVAVYLTDEADKPVAPTGFKANAIFVVGAQPVRFALAPADKVKLAGTAPVAVPVGVKGAVQITAPDGSTAQAKY
ncbi:MAG: hypothetical protein JSS20_00385 [Proteobacteria bacterium]|nr:hypothetical protein [Pseudomonadota bacterium]